MAQLIQRSQNILGGTPVFAKTRVPIRALIDYFEGGKSLDDFLNDFPTVNRRQATAVLEALKKVLLKGKHAGIA